MFVGVSYSLITWVDAFIFGFYFTFESAIWKAIKAPTHLKS